MFDTRENSHVRKVLHFDSLNLCIRIFKHFYMSEIFSVYKTSMCFKSEVYSHFLKRLRCVTDGSRGQYSEISYLFNFSACHGATSIYKEDDIFGKHWHFVGCKIMHKIPIDDLKYRM